MTDNTSGTRLGKAAKEFNVGIQTLVDHLSKRGSKVDSNPNSKISSTDYALLVKEFAADRDVKSKVQSIDSNDTENKVKPVEPKAIVPIVEEVEEEKILMIKSTQIEPEIKIEKSIPKQEVVIDTISHVKANQPKILGKIDLGSLDQPPKRKGKVEEKSTPKKDTKPKDKTEEVIEKIVNKETSELKPVIESANTVEPLNIAPLNIELKKEEIKKDEVEQNKVEKDEIKQSKIEVESKVITDVKDKTENKEKAEKSIDKKKTEKPVESKIVVSAETKVEERVIEKKTEKKIEKDVEKKGEKKIIEDKSVETVVNKPVEPVEIHVEKKDDDNFLKTKYVKLDGPNVLRTIDLTQFNKPAKKQPIASSSDETTSSKQKKNKRKRIKSDTPQPTTGHGQSHGQAGAKQGQGNTSSHHSTTNHQHNTTKTHTGTTGNAGANAGKPGTNSGSGNAHKTWKPTNPNQQTGGTANSGNKKYVGNNPYKKGGVKDTKPAAAKVEPTDEEVKKQIQETLARLSPAGKSKASKHKRDKRELRREIMADASEMEAKDKLILKVSEFVTVNELATMMDVPVTQVISTCMNLGMFVSINMRLDAEALVIVADEFGFKLDFVGADIDEELTAIKSDDSLEDLTPRPPIVTVMGHVDHGKTKLLDYIRSSNVVAGEAGGITQHIGAYEVQLPSGKKIAFLDTPGHEAFTAMRARGAEVTDVAIIVIAADDSVMPQTKEAINHAQAANVPIVFAFNKVDKPTADVEKIKNALSQMNILVEDWGGKYQSQEISAKTGLNVSTLLDKVLLEAELLDLRANPNRNASGTIIESSLDKGRGYVAKIMVQNGTLKVGDVLIAGCVYGKVKAMYNERNQIIKEAGPSTPLLLLGLNGAPQAGDKFVVMADEKEAKNIVTRRQQLQREQGLRTQKHITLDEIGRRIAIGDFKELNIIVKGDVDGSVEALSDSLLKLSTQEVQVNVIHRSVGQVTESDIMLASASNAIIVAFQVRPSVNARRLAETEQIDIRVYSIIYNAIEEIKSAIEGMLSPEIEEKILCNVEVRETFKIPKVGTIAGCMVLDGVITRNTKVRVIRDGIVVYNGSLGSLKRFKDDVKEVKTGYECGLNIDNYNDIKIGDIVEGYDFVEIKRTLS